MPDVDTPRPPPPPDPVFLAPPRRLNAAGQPRRTGFEFEYAGLDVERSAELVRAVFGGDVEVVSPSIRSVRTPLGPFSVEVDSSVIKDQRYRSVLRAVGLERAGLDHEPVERALMGMVANWVPFEIGTPPLPFDQFGRLDDLRRRLLAAGAQGTRTSARFAFGMHINPELPGDDAGSVRDHLRAFLLLQPWLKGRVDVDLTRRVMPFINPFPNDYARLVLQHGYPADLGRLIDDYIAYNPTRNRPLDLLPALAHLDAERVMARVEDPHLVKARPAYHYRLPNCLVDEPDWSIAREWNTWVAVERLAADPARLAAMAGDYLEADEQSFRPFVDKWPAVLEEYMSEGRKNEG
ncbi:MAG: hypothetical protein JWO31_345 [Phycisphaerales bacterium]|nr:hypothetical protein [Phycisphaerales bacterium]